MKRKIGLTLVAIATALSLGLMVAGPANASSWTSHCSVGGYNFDGTTVTSGTIFYSYRVGYHTSSPVGLEWRVQVIEATTGYLRYDSGYQSSSSINSVYRTPNVWVGSPVYMRVYAGRWNDGYATCVMAYTQGG